MSSLDLGLIGNCSIGALVDRYGNFVWACMPRFDSEPVFDNLLKNEPVLRGDGIFAIELLDFERAEQRYIDDTAILRTCLYDKHGGGIEIVDFAPRFKQFGRMFRPVMLVRQMRALSGSPRIRFCPGRPWPAAVANPPFPMAATISATSRRT